MATTSSASTSPPSPTLISYLLVSLTSTLSAATAPYPHQSLHLFTSLLRRLAPLLTPLLHQPILPPIRPALEALDSELRRARVLLRDSLNPKPLTATLLEGSARAIGRCLAMLTPAWEDAPEELIVLQREMVAAEFGSSRVRLDLEEVMVRVKRGGEEELGAALMELGFLFREGLLGEAADGFVPVLVKRLGEVDKHNRLKIILVLRSLASNTHNIKESMTDAEALSNIVRSLTRDVDESREAAGLLVDLLDIPKVRQRIGRVQGCIVMLVALFNADDPCAARDAGKLLDALSSNTQNVLLMAEAGYFIPMVQYLREGSDMNKILMATSISRMELTDQMKASLGEEGSVEPLVSMFTMGKLEAKHSALGALCNLASLDENIPRLINSGIVAPLLQILFSVTSVLMTLQEPASAILASIAQSELILTYKGVSQRMLSLLNLSSPVVQLHLLLALNSIAGHSNAKRFKSKMRENGVVQLLLPFLIERSGEIRIIALNLLFNISKEAGEDLTGQLGETHLNILVDIISTSMIEKEKAAAVGVLSNLPVNDKKVTEILTRTNLLPVLISLLETSITGSSIPTSECLIEGIAGVLVRFTVPWDKKLQRVTVAHGVIPYLVKLLADGSSAAKSRAATSLAQLSLNSISPKPKSSKWLCGPPSSQTFCEVHNGNCTVKTTFCLVKANAISPMIHILEGKEREAHEVVLNALATLMQDEIWENGANAIAKVAGVPAIVGVLDEGSLEAQEKAIWILERIFRLDTYKQLYGEAAGIVLTDLAHNGNPTLKPMIAKILAHL